MWKVTFEEDGGYDCKTPAYLLTHVGTREAFAIDTRDFDWFVNANTITDLEAHRTKVMNRCEVIALAIAVALNILE